MNGLVFDDATCELVPIAVAMQKPRERDYLRVEQFQPATPRITVMLIQRVVSEHYGLSPNDMSSQGRSRRIARPRQLAMHLAREMAKRSFPEIGRAFGGRDHSTVIHAIRTITGLLATDAKLRAGHDAIVEALRG